jgi:hypothetical protein
MKILRVRFFLILSLLIGLSSLPISRVAAEISQAGGSNQKAAPAHGYQIKFVQPHASKLCIGETTILEAEFGQAGLLPPLWGVSSITFWTSNGNSFSPEEVYPVSMDGLVSSTFTAKNAGTDKINVDVSVYHYENGTPSGQDLSDFDTTTIKVQKCKYHFDLHGQLDTTINQGGASESLEFTLHAEGDLSEDPDQSGHLSGSAEISLEYQILELHVEGCAVTGYDPGLGEGTADATADISDDGTSVQVTLGASDDFDWKVNASGRCEDQSVNINKSGITLTGDLVDGAAFSDEGGTEPVQVAFLDLGLSRFEAAGGTGSDSAMLTLTEEDTSAG